MRPRAFSDEEFRAAVAELGAWSHALTQRFNCTPCTVQRHAARLKISLLREPTITKAMLVAAIAKVGHNNKALAAELLTRPSYVWQLKHKYNLENEEIMQAFATLLATWRAGGTAADVAENTLLGARTTRSCFRLLNYLEKTKEISK